MKENQFIAFPLFAYFGFYLFIFIIGVDNLALSMFYMESKVKMLI